MAGEEEPKAHEPIFTPASGLPPAHLPTAYADGITNVFPTGHTVKFYLFRTDSEIAGNHEFANHVFAQVVMPIDGFIGMAWFMNNAIENMIKRGTISKEEVDNIRQIYSEGPRG